MSHTLAEKILQSHTDETVREPGQIVNCRLSGVLANDITGSLAINSFRAMGAKRVFDKEKIFLVMDHFTPQKDIESANQVLQCRAFAAETGVVHYYEGGNAGVEHALLPELGLVGPGDLVIGADSHTCTYGGLGAFGTGLGSTDIAAGMATGELWFKVPPTIKAVFNGEAPRWIAGKDLMLRLIGEIGVDGALYRALEFHGRAIDDLDVEGRMSMANMAIEAGAKNGIFPVDDKTRAYLDGRVTRPWEAVEPDADAEYEREVVIDLDTLQPTVALPHLPSNTRTVDQVAGTHIDQVVIGSCTNGRLEDLRQAAAVLKGRKVAAGVRCIVIPATQQITLDAMAEGLIQTFIEAGCAVSTPTCGPCLGGHMGVLSDGERAISTTNRNFVGRMGPVSSEIILANPAVAAASAVAGCVADPRKL